MPTDLSKSSMDLFPGLTSFIKDTKLTLREKFEIPIIHIISFLMFTCLVIIPYFIMKKYYYIIENITMQDKALWVSASLMITGSITLTLANLFYMVLYLGNWPMIEAFKGSDAPWPWADKAKWPARLRRMLLLTFLNLTVFTFPVAYLRANIMDDSVIIDSNAYPSFVKYMIHFVWMFMMEDFLFYWSHRLLHIPYLYKKIHKVHHESTVTISLSAIATHPLEYFLGNLMPTQLGIMLCPGKIHFASAILFVVFRVVNTVEGHSGYGFKFGFSKFFPCVSAANYHNHHHLMNIGNFGSQLYIWDSIFGTNKEYMESLQKGLDTKEKGAIVKLKVDESDEFKLKKE